MNLEGKNVLITGGGSGIGLETALRFVKLGCRVLITGRNSEKLTQAAGLDDALSYQVCDVTNTADVAKLAEYVKNDFGGIQVLMNNAGLAFLHQLDDHTSAYDLARQEITTNYLSAINMISHLLPVLREQSEAAIINVSSITGFSPALSLPTYSASKAALHAYSQALRHSLALVSAIKVFEVMPSLVDTDFAKDIPAVKISAAEVAEAIIKGVSNDIGEIHVGDAVGFYDAFFSKSPQAMLVLNRLA
ncbi:SDR family oxidoreductase [uncultured Chitinophaga sp.]|uniref:SDR family oxidoreductase n=1 Tax=uncultured Chitinophaga sp. TaxID=339340 RepID=UPI0025DE03E2|nr:SDR family NAD(P)-dependent oxidoreductase [uncultured Chitinophaga sp.]